MFTTIFSSIVHLIIYGYDAVGLWYLLTEVLLSMGVLNDVIFNINRMSYIIILETSIQTNYNIVEKIIK